MVYRNSRGEVYYLNYKRVKVKGVERDCYYFSRDKRDTYCEELPEGCVVVESKRSGLPLVKFVKKVNDVVGGDSEDC